MKPINKILVLILHPLLMPTYLYICLSFFSKGLIGQFTNSQILILSTMVFITTFIMPLLIVLLQMTYQYEKFSFTALLMEDSKKRVVPFIITGCFYLYLSYHIYQSWSSQLVIALVIACVGICILIAGIISRFWKISAHAIGIGGFVGFCIALNIHYLQSNLFYLLLAALVLSGVLLSARLYTQAHTSAQVYSGWIMGVSICYFSNFLI
jgi:hypothetical protein